MKTLFVDQCAQLAGGELNLYDYLRSAPEGASVVLLEEGPFRGLLENLGVPVSVVPLSAIGKVRRSADLRAIGRVLPTVIELRRRLSDMAANFDVLYANSQKAFLLSALARRKGQPLVWHLHDMLVPEHFSTPLRKLAVFAGNHFASVIIANSRATAKAYIDAGGRSDKLRVVYCGLDAGLFDRADLAKVAALRKELGTGERYTVAVFGRLAEWKGQLVLLDAIAHLPDVQAVLVGDAFFGEDAYKERLLERAAQPDIAGRVRLLGFRKDVPELMLAVDAIAHTSTSPEPFGRVIVEGMLAARPVIATCAGGAAELIEDGVSGLAVASGSATELALAIKRLRNDRSMAERVAQAGRARAVESFSLDTMVSTIRALIEAQVRG